jgi:hypothetical protein
MSARVTPSANPSWNKTFSANSLPSHRTALCDSKSDPLWDKIPTEISQTRLHRCRPRCPGHAGSIEAQIDWCWKYHANRTIKALSYLARTPPPRYAAFSGPKLSSYVLCITGHRTCRLMVSVRSYHATRVRLGSLSTTAVPSPSPIHPSRYISFKIATLALSIHAHPACLLEGILYAPSQHAIRGVADYGHVAHGHRNFPRGIRLQCERTP